jgi:Endodeoxyribonuclease RusA
MPLLEFTVDGPPVSYQTRDKANLVAWKALIRAEAGRCWGENPILTTNLKCTIINFHEGAVASLDDDNMVKPIRDAMNRLVYRDDRQITYSETIQVCIDAPIKIWLSGFAGHLGKSEVSDVVKEAIRQMAQTTNYQCPPLR